MQHSYRMDRSTHGAPTVQGSLAIKTHLERSLNSNPLRLVVAIIILF